MREGLRAGTIAAAATAGALVALGRAHGAALRPLNSVAHIVAGSRAYYMEGANWLITPLAIGVHLASILAWGALFSLFTRGVRGSRLYLAAIGFAAATWVIDYRVVPSRLRPGFESGLSGMEIALVYLVLGVSLAWGLVRERDSSTR
jgi:hypothetical protein